MNNSYTFEKTQRINGKTTLINKWTPISEKEYRKEINRLKKFYPIAWDDRKAKGSIGFAVTERITIVAYKNK